MEAETYKYYRIEFTGMNLVYSSLMFALPFVGLTNIFSEGEIDKVWLFIYFLLLQISIVGCFIIILRSPIKKIDTGVPIAVSDRRPKLSIVQSFKHKTDNKDENE